MKSRTTPKPNRLACVSIARPISLTAAPGHRVDAARSASRVRSPAARTVLVDVADEERGVGVAVHAVQVDAVMSTLTMSPSCERRSSGMPWQITSFTDVHSDFGKPL